MISADTISTAVSKAVHRGLVRAVKDVEKSHEFGKDMWFEYIHRWAPIEPGQSTVSKDPAKYSVKFLGDFLQCVSRKSIDEDAINEFTSRKCRKVERPVHDAASFNATYVDTVWIVVGDSVLHGARPASTSSGYQLREVALPTDLIHHSGSAVSMLLACISAGILEQKLRVRLADAYKFGCIHFEGKFYQFPHSSDQDAWESRIDNLNNSLRAWGVDAKATRDALGQKVRSNLHPRLQHFVGIGVGAVGPVPCFHLDPDAFLYNLTTSGKRVLFDGRLVEMLYASNWENNGITTWFAHPWRCGVNDIVDYYGGDNRNTLVLVLTHSGIVLRPPSSYERTETSNIWVNHLQAVI